MAELEKIYGTDAGTVAIKKLDRNIKAINLGMENIDISKQIGTHNTDEEAHPKLAKQIGVLSEDRGYLNTNFLPNNTDWNTITKNGIYRINTWADDAINAPPQNEFGRLLGVCVVWNMAFIVYQTVYIKNRRIERSCNSDGWTDWICDSDKITALQGKIEWKQDDFKTEGALPSEYDNKKTTIFFARTPFNGYQYSIVKVTKYNDNFCRMELIGEDNKPLCYRLSNKGAWGKWQSIATMDKIDILCTPRDGYKIVEDKSYICSGRAFIDVSIAKTDDSIFGNIVNNVGVATVPVTPKILMQPLSAIGLNHVNGNIMSTNVKSCINPGSGLWITIDNANSETKIIRICGEVNI